MVRVILKSESSKADQIKRLGMTVNLRHVFGLIESELRLKINAKKRKRLECMLI